MSFLLSNAWLMRRTIQSNKALYRDLAMESLAVMAWWDTERNESGFIIYHQWNAINDKLNIYSQEMKIFGAEM